MRPVAWIANPAAHGDHAVGGAVAGGLAGRTDRETRGLRLNHEHPL